jgi:hypothetical protein
MAIIKIASRSPCGYPSQDCSRRLQVLHHNW